MKILRNTAAFTLIEVLISIAIISIAIMSIYTLHITSIKGISKASIISKSSNTMQGQIEQIIGESYDNSDFSTGNHTINISNIDPLSSNNATLTWIVKEWINDGIDNDQDSQIDEFDERGIKDIQIRIQYYEHGIAQSTSLHFLKAEIF